MNLDTLPYVPARHQWPRPQRTDWIVLHSVEGATGQGAAMRTAEYFRAIDRVASAHYCVDPRSVVTCVRPDRMAAHAAVAQVNQASVGIEMCGRAAWSRDQWLAPDQIGMLERTAELTAALCERFGIPADFIGANITGQRGITTHADVTRAFGVKGGHSDPGAGFPMDVLVDKTRALLGGAPSLEEDEDMKHELLIDDRDGRVWEVCGLSKRYIDSPDQLSALQDRWGLPLSVAPPWVIDTRKVYADQVVGAPMIDPAKIAGLTADEIAKRLANG